jgi:hypothetical protein
VCITGSDKFGLPTAKDEDVLLALVQLTKITNEFSDPEVCFTKHQIIELLGWENRGWAYDRVEESLHRWKGVGIHYWNAWRDNAKGTWRDSEAIGVIEYFKITDGRRRRDSPNDQSRIVWNKALFDSFRAGYLKKLDFGNYRTLRRPASKRAYRFLDKRFYHEPKWEFDLREFACEKLGLSRAYTTGQLKQQLNPTFGELQGIGFIEPVKYRKECPKKWTLEIHKKCSDNVSLSAVQPNKIAESLVSRGVATSVAQELATTFAEEFLTAKVELFDWLMKRRDKRVAKNPPGFLVSAIRKDYPEPREFVAARNRGDEPKTSMEKSARTSLESRQVLPTPEEHSTMEVGDVVGRYLGSLSDLEVQRLELAAVAEAPSIEAESFQRRKAVGGELFVSLRRSLLRKYVTRHGLHLGQCT